MGFSVGASIRIVSVSVLLFLGHNSCAQAKAAMSDPVLTDGLDAFNRGSYNYALPRLLQAANHGSPVAMRRLGILYQDGLVHQADPGWGLQWFQRAVFAKDATAYSYIGDLYAKGSLGHKDAVAAKTWYRRAYAGKDARGTMILAELAYRGNGPLGAAHGVELLNEANRFHQPTDETSLQPRMAADFYEMGQRYEKGEAAPHSPLLAASLYAKSAALGRLSAAVAESALYLGQHGLPKNLTKAETILDAFQKANSIQYRMTENNDAAFALGNAFAAVADATVKLGSAQAPRAVPVYKKAALLGVALPMVQFAKRLATGDGITRNVPAAYAVLVALPPLDTVRFNGTEAAEVADLLAGDYANGDGVAADPVRAKALSQMARRFRNPVLYVAPVFAAEQALVPPSTLQRYPNMLAPPSVAPGAQFPVSVSLNASKLDQGTGVVSGDNGSGQLNIPFPDGMTSVQIVVTLMPSKMTIVDGVYQRTIELTRTQDTLPAVFLLKANADAGPSTIFATLSYNGAPIGMIRRDVTVAAAPAPVIIGSPAPADSVTHLQIAAPTLSDAKTVPNATPVTFNPEERAADMTITELTETGSGLRYIVTTKESEFDESSVASSATVKAIVNKLYSDMESWGEQLDEGTLSSTQVKNYVNGAMSAFYDQQAPDAFKRIYAKLEKRGERPQTILVLTDKPVLPWELMRPTGADGLREDPLALTVAIVHTNSTSAPKTLPPLVEGVEAIAVVAPAYSGDTLAGAQQEVKNMQAVFPDLQQVSGTLTAVSKLAQHPPQGIVHYAGHGVVTQGKLVPDSLALPLSDSNTMDPATWKGLVEDGTGSGQATHPFYFFNACDQGQSQGVLNYVDGWAPALMQSGASGYLGALWKVSDTTAESFSKHFYTELAQKMAGNQPWSVADVVTDARAATFKEKFDPTALAYILYSHPYLTMNQR